MNSSKNHASGMSVIFYCANLMKGVFEINIFPPIERRADGSLSRISARQRQMAVKLIKYNCSNYFDGNCLLLDDSEGHVCFQSISYSINCRFFRYVLLEDKEGLLLKSQLFRDETIKQCLVCGKTFRSKSNNAKYCDCCKKDVQRKQKAEYAKRRRSRVEK